MEQNPTFIPKEVNTFMSDQINEIAVALSAFQGSIKQPSLNKEVTVQTKTGRNYNFKYADLSECVKAAAPLLKAHGLAVTQLIFDGKLATLLLHKSGQWIKSVLNLPERLSDFQALGSAITYLKRYSYCAILGIVADDDDDANAAVGNTVEEKTHQSAAPILSPNQMEQAYMELEACKDSSDIAALWEKYKHIAPDLCKKGTVFFEAVSKKSQSLR